MKVKEIHDELVEAAKKLGITVRKESGNFRSGYCKINEEEVILLNKSAPIESLSGILAKTISKREVDNIFLKPAVRDMIENEKNNSSDEENFELEIDY